MFGGSAWSRLPDGSFYLHLFAPGAARPELGRTRRCRRTSRDPAVLARRAASTGSGWMSRVGWPRTQPTARSARGPHPHWDRPEVHDLYRSWPSVFGDTPAVAEAWGRPNAPPRSRGPTSCGQAFAFDVLRTPWSLRRCGGRSTPSAGGPPRGRRAAGVGGRQPRHRAGSPPASGRRGAARSTCSCSPCPARSTSTRATSWACRTPWAPRAVAGPAVAASGGRLPNRDGARVPLPWTSGPGGLLDRRAVAADPAGLGAATPATGRRPTPTSTWSVLHRALAARSALDDRGR